MFGAPCCFYCKTIGPSSLETLVSMHLRAKHLRKFCFHRGEFHWSQTLWPIQAEHLQHMILPDTQKSDCSITKKGLDLGGIPSLLSIEVQDCSGIIFLFVLTVLSKYFRLPPGFVLFASWFCYVCSEVKLSRWNLLGLSPVDKSQRSLILQRASGLPFSLPYCITVTPLTKLVFMHSEENIWVQKCWGPSTTA